LLTFSCQVKQDAGIDFDRMLDLLSIEEPRKLLNDIKEQTAKKANSGHGNQGCEVPGRPSRNGSVDGQ